MATKVWCGGATAVAQIATASVDTYDAASTYTVTVGNYDISAAGDTDVATTAGNLVTALNASTHPYFAAITWTNPSAGNVTGTADVAGAPFAAALTVSGGTGTVTDFSDDTACTGPHHFDQADNWTGGALPIANDDLIIESGPSILYALDHLASTDLGDVEIRQSFTAKIGLEATAFATSLDGETLDTSVREYRDDYLELYGDWTIGAHVGPGTPSGSPRLCLDKKSTGTIDIVNTSATSVSSRPAVRLLAASASVDVIVRRAPSGVGVAVEPGATSTLGDILIVDDSTTSEVYIGPGASFATFESHGGEAQLCSTATVTSVTVHGGTVAIHGAGYQITTLNLFGGEVDDSHDGGVDAWATVNLYGGTLKLPGFVGGTRTFTTMNLYGGRVEADWSALSGGTVVIKTDDQVSPLRAVELTEL